MTWSPLAKHGLNQEVYALAVVGTDVYVGGTFTQTADGSLTNLYSGKSKAKVKKATTTKLTVTIPSKCKAGKTYDVQVKVNGLTTNTVQFTAK